MILPSHLFGQGGTKERSMIRWCGDDNDKIAVMVHMVNSCQGKMEVEEKLQFILRNKEGRRQVRDR
jgi:hypothetical protein